jgi:hypothetical protein
MERLDPVAQFLQLHLTTLGAVAEPSAGALEALLPAEVAAAMGLPEEVRFGFDGGAAASGAAVDARLGSPLLEQVVAARRDQRPVATVAVPGQLPRALPDHVPVLLNAVRAGPAAPAPRVPARYLIAHLRVALQGDEVRSALLDLTLRLADGAVVRPIDLAQAYPIAPGPLSVAELEHASGALRRAVRRGIPIALAGALEAIGRRARRDLTRLADYYVSLDGEMARAVERTRSDDERRRRLAKWRLLADELAARRAQVRERLSARVGAELIGAVVVETEVDRHAFPVRRRASEGTVTVQRRAADGSLEGPRCDGCGIGTLQVYLCDERLHVLCEACGQAGRLDRSRCAACTARPAAPLGVTVRDVTASLRLGGDRVGAVPEEDF